MIAIMLIVSFLAGMAVDELMYEETMKNKQPVVMFSSSYQCKKIEKQCKYVSVEEEKEKGTKDNK